MPKRPHIGIQLYTLRDLIPNNVTGILKFLSETGYTEVETFDYSTKTGYWGFTPKQFNQMLRDFGLHAPSGHYDSDTLLKDGNTEDLKNQIDAVVTTGGEFLTIPWINEAFRQQPDDYKRLAERMNEAGRLCNAAGIKLGYHNHNFEFMPQGDESGYHVLLRETDATLVHFEMDIYWVVRSGNDPKKIIEQHPGRFPLWHVKDMATGNPDDNTEIGNGLISYPEIFTLADAAGLQHFFVEQETNYNPDPKGAAAKSFQYLQSIR